MGWGRAIVVVSTVGLLVACSAFGGSDDTSPAASDGGALATSGGDASSDASAIACFSCGSAPDCQTYGPAAFCGDAGPFVIDVQPGNPAPTCRADVLELTSPSTLDASLRASFAVDGIPSVTVGIRASFRGFGTVLRIADFRLEAQDGPADDLVFAFCSDKTCEPVLTTKDTDATMRDWVMQLTFPASDGGSGSVLRAQADCGAAVTLTSPHRPASLEVEVGPIDTSSPSVVDIAALRIVRPRG